MKGEAVKPLRRVRVLKEMSQGDLSKSSGVSRQVISNIERGVSKGYLNTYIALADALGVDVDELMERGNSGKVPRPLLSLDVEQRRAVMQYVTERTRPTVGGDMKWLGTLKRAIKASGMSDEEFRAWARRVEPNEVRDLLLPEDREETTIEEAFANA